MIIDYIFYRVYQAYARGPQVNEPIKAARYGVFTLMQMFTIPIGMNIAVLYGSPNHITNVIPYFLIDAIVYMIICKKYNKQRVQTILERYGQVKKFKIPAFLICMLVGSSVGVGIILMVLLDFYVMGPLGLIGCLKM